MGLAALGCLLVISLWGCRGGSGGITPIRTAFNKGVYQHSVGNFEAAIAEYRQALEEDDTDHRARFNLAVALEALASRRRAKGHANAASQLQAEAQNEYRQILRVRPHDVRSSVNLAAIEYEKGLRDDAFRRLQWTLEAHPKAVAPRVAWAAHLLRESQAGADNGPIERARLDEARTLLEEAISEDPASVEGNMLLGDVYFALGSSTSSDSSKLYNRARRSYRTALERAPSDVATLLSLSRLELELGDRASSQTWLRRILFIDPEHRTAHRILAEILEHDGDLEGAIKHLWKVRDLDPDAESSSSLEYRKRLIDLYRRMLATEEAHLAE